MSLNSISDAKMRNLIRGLINAENESVLHSTFGNLKKIRSASKAFEAFRFLHNNQLAANFPHAEPFPPTPQRSTSGHFFKNTHIENEVIAQLVRFEKYEDLCSAFLIDVTELDLCTIRGDGAEVLITLFSKIFASYGHSISILKRVISVKYLLDGSEEFDRFFQSVIYEYNRPLKDIVAICIDDSHDTSMSYIGVRQTFSGYIKYGQITGSAASLIQDHFSPFSSEANDLSNALQAYGLVSLPDALLYVLRMRSQIKKKISAVVAGSLDTQLDNLGLTQWDDAHQDIDLEFFDIGMEREEKLLEYRILKQSAAWLDWRNIFEHRRWVERMMYQRLNATSSAGITTEEFSDWPPTFSLEAMVHNPCIRPHTLGEINPSRDGCLHRTIALFDLIKKEKAQHHYLVTNYCNCSIKPLIYRDFPSLKNLVLFSAETDPINSINILRPHWYSTRPQIRLHLMYLGSGLNNS